MKYLIFLLLFSMHLFADEISISAQITAVQSETDKVENYNHINQIYVQYMTPDNGYPMICAISNITVTNSCNNPNSLWKNGINVFSKGRANNEGLKCSHIKIAKNKYELTVTDKLNNETDEYNFVIKNNKIIGFKGKHSYLDITKNKYRTINYVHVGQKVYRAGQNVIPTQCEDIIFYDDFQR